MTQSPTSGYCAVKDVPKYATHLRYMELWHEIDLLPSIRAEGNRPVEWKVDQLTEAIPVLDALGRHCVCCGDTIRTVGANKRLVWHSASWHSGTGQLSGHDEHFLRFGRVVEVIKEANA